MGSAGSAGPVTELMLGQIWGEVNSIDDVLRRLGETLGTALNLTGPLLGSRPIILNISASTRLPAVLDVLLTPPWGLLTEALRAKGVLIVAAAGNDGRDVDSETCVLNTVCWESDVVVPCEMANVLCVGGIQADSLKRHDRSAWGSKGASVDLFAPFTLWTVDADAVAEGRARGVRLSSGTSYSAPFVSGVAALVWAANPALGPGDVERILLQTATPSPDPQVRRVVNAAQAVRAALGPVGPRIFAWPQERIQVPLNQPLTVALNSPAQVRGLDVNLLAYPGTPGPLQLELSSSVAGDRLDGSLLRMASPGLRTVTATVTDSSGARDSRSFEVQANQPASRLFAVLGGSQVWGGQAAYGSALGFEQGAGGFDRVDCSRVVWTLPARVGMGGVRIPIGHLSTELEGADGVGPRLGAAKGCDAEMWVEEGTHGVRVELRAADGRTVLQERVLPLHVGARVDAQAAGIGMLGVIDRQDFMTLRPRLMITNTLGYFTQARWLRANWNDPGARGVTKLSFSVESLVNGALVDLAMGPQGREEDGWLPNVGAEFPASWAGDRWLDWFAPGGEPTVVALRFSVVDSGLTATRPYLVELRNDHNPR